MRRNRQTGEMLVPCNFDSINIYPGDAYGYLSSYKFSSNSFLNRDTSNVDGTFKYKKGNIEAMLLSNPPLEAYLAKKLSSKVSTTDTLGLIGFYSAKLFKEVRQKCIDYVVEGKEYGLTDIDVISRLDSLETTLLEKELITFPSQIKQLEDNDIRKFLAIISRKMYLLILKDRINNKDYPSVFTLSQMHPLLYFTDMASNKITCTFKTNQIKSISEESAAKSKKDTTNRKARQRAGCF